MSASPAVVAAVGDVGGVLAAEAVAGVAALELAVVRALGRQGAGGVVDERSG